MTQNGKSDWPTKNGEGAPADSSKDAGARPPRGVMARFLKWLIRGAEKSRRDRGRCPT